MKTLRRLLGFLAVIGVVAAPAVGQSPREKPKLVRREAVPDQPEEAEIVPDAAVARKHMEVGDFYFKRDNFKAAADRYREAVKYAPANPDPYERLVRALERMDDYVAAAKVCDDFVLANPDSAKSDEFQRKAVELEAKAKG